MLFCALIDNGSGCSISARGGNRGSGAAVANGVGGGGGRRNALFCRHLAGAASISVDQGSRGDTGSGGRGANPGSSVQDFWAIFLPYLTYFGAWESVG